VKQAIEETMHGHREAMLERWAQRLPCWCGNRPTFVVRHPINALVGRTPISSKAWSLSSITLARIDSSMGSNNSLHPLAPRSFTSLIGSFFTTDCTKQ
jgi:hypothetical protein